MERMNNKIIVGSIITVAILVLIAFNPAVNAQVCKYSVKQRLVDIREFIFNILIENDWKYSFHMIILAIFFFCIVIVENYLSTIWYKEANDLYPILTKL